MLKRFTFLLGILFIYNEIGSAQKPTPSTTDQMIEGGKTVVEILKLFGNKHMKSKEEIYDCKRGFADFCVDNLTTDVIVVTVKQFGLEEKRELVIQPTGHECILHIKIGVWTYEIKSNNSIVLLRKGDVLIEACNVLIMNVR